MLALSVVVCILVAGAFVSSAASHLLLHAHSHSLQRAGRNCLTAAYFILTCRFWFLLLSTGKIGAIHEITLLALGVLSCGAIFMNAYLFGAFRVNAGISKQIRKVIDGLKRVVHPWT